MHDLAPVRDEHVGPFALSAIELPHFVRNLALQVRVGHTVLAYTGDCGFSAATVELAEGAAVFLADASSVETVPEESATGLSSARDRGAVAEAAGAGRLVLCHLWSGTDEAPREAAARSTYSGEVLTAQPGLIVEL